LCFLRYYDQYIYKKLGRYDKAMEGEAIMRMKIFLLVLLALSCLMFTLPIAASFPAVYHDSQHPSFSFFTALVQAIIVHPNDPGSGGGGTGVIK
jgi:hypothetical protein